MTDTHKLSSSNEHPPVTSQVPRVGDLGGMLGVSHGSSHGVRGAAFSSADSAGGECPAKLFFWSVGGDHFFVTVASVATGSIKASN